MMRDGKLLAMDTPMALKARYVPQTVWEVYATPLNPSLNAFSTNPAVVRASLAGDHLRVTGQDGLGAPEIERIAQSAGIQLDGVHAGEANLEDVFITLVKD